MTMLVLNYIRCPPRKKQVLHFKCQYSPCTSTTLSSGETCRSSSVPPSPPALVPPQNKTMLIHNSVFPYPASECFTTLGTDKGSRDKVGVVVSFEVHIEELFLTEGFITMATGIRLFSSMGPFVHDHVPLLRDKQDMKSNLRTQTDTEELIFGQEEPKTLR